MRHELWLSPFFRLPHLKSKMPEGLQSGCQSHYIVPDVDGTRTIAEGDTLRLQMHIGINRDNFVIEFKVNKVQPLWIENDDQQSIRVDDQYLHMAEGLTLAKQSGYEDLRTLFTMFPVNTFCWLVTLGEKVNG